MRLLHIANTFFEWELETDSLIPLSEAFQQHLIFRQLQFLPVLYAKAQDGVLVTHLPVAGYEESLRELGITPPKILLASDGAYSTIESWGPSRIVAQFAKKHRLSYAMPDWELVKQINSKEFSFSSSPQLSGARLLRSTEQAREWIASLEGVKVLKTCYGVSGKGHLIIGEGGVPWEKIARFVEAEWKKGYPVIGEPWVTRVIDFSTQWHISKEGELEYIGATLCTNDARGQYLYNTVGEEAVLFKEHMHHLKQHKQIVEPLLLQIAKRGFFGNLGIDAMIYLQEGEHKLHPVVEINARKTMGWAALAFQRRYHPAAVVCFKYTSAQTGYLPSALAQQGKTVYFPRNLQVDTQNPVVA